MRNVTARQPSVLPPFASQPLDNDSVREAGSLSIVAKKCSRMEWGIATKLRDSLMLFLTLCL